MATYTPYLNLEKFTTSERLDVLKINANSDKIDAGVSELNNKVANPLNVAYTSVTGTSQSQFESALVTAIDGMGVNGIRVCPAYANYSQSLTNGGQAVAFLVKQTTAVWWCFLVYASGVRAGYYTNSAWTWI